MSETNFEQFGRAMYRLFRDDEDFFGNEDSELIMPIAVECGLARRGCWSVLEYGVHESLEDGDECWLWADRP